MIAPEYPPMQGGVGDYTSLLVQALRNLGVETSVITSTRASTSEQRDPEISFVPGWGFGSWRLILEHIRAHRPDVINIQYQTAGYGMHPAINLLPLRLRLAGRRPKVVTTFHDLKVPYLFPKAGRVRQVPGTLLAGCSDAVIVTNCEDLAQIGEIDERNTGFRTRFQGRALHAIPIGSNISVNPPVGYNRQAWRAALGVAPGETLLCYFGFLNRAKGIETLLEAFQIMLTRGRKVKLLMAGGAFGDSDPTNLSYGKGIIATIEGSHYKDKVLWTGFVSQAEISASLLSTDVCVLPYNEGASLRHGTLMAAIGHGLAIVATQTPGSEVGRLRCRLPSLKDCIMHVPPGQPEAMASAIETLIDCQDKAADLRKRVAELAPAFSWQTVAKDTVGVFRSLVTE